jgi:hypothetical protein
MSPRQKAFAVGLAATIATSMLASATLAAKRIPYAEAWRLRKAEIDSSGAHSAGVSHERYHRGSACMHKYGHRI